VLKKNKTAELLNKINRLEEIKKDYLELKSRWRSDVEHARLDGSFKTAAELTEVIDDLNRAIIISRKNKDLVKNLKVVRNSLLERFNKLGFYSFAKKGDLFDPKIHRAISTTSKGQDNHIYQVESLGWQDRDGNLVKPAVVVVGKETK
jgi:molecular chaperone GrpE (heat shock protein)